LKLTGSKVVSNDHLKVLQKEIEKIATDNVGTVSIMFSILKLSYACRDVNTFCSDKSYKSSTNEMKNYKLTMFCVPYCIVGLNVHDVTMMSLILCPNV